MSNAIIVAPWGAVEAPTWTPAVIAANGDKAPGYSYIGSCPRPNGVASAVLWVDASDACMTAIQADGVNYIYIEDVTPTEVMP